MLLQTNLVKTAGLITGFMLLLVSICASVVLGYTQTSWDTAINAFTNFNGSNEHLIIQTVRLPRAAVAVVVGASLAVAGALMQALTKNPLASPGVFGINAGAGFFVVIAVSIFGVSSLQAFTWISFLGAAVAAFTVYFAGSFGREGLTPMKLTLAGAAMAALFSSLTQGFLVSNEAALDQVLFWLAGSVQGRKLELLYSVLPYIGIAFVICIFLASKINLLMMGEDVAKGLGQKTGTVKLITAAVIILLAGGAVAIAGPVGFVGIVIPHIARFFVGNDHRWILPYCAVLGGVLLVTADIGARFVAMPEEVPVGVMTALVGTPFFIYIARRGFQK
ncbi:iron ABC transporter permease [Metabacillus idriensis]|uniref:Iron chelate uptake ABC transporter family permease subunit n=1 Tax=Metabacillus idriensis TaxID=324768 RepID=A0A6I2MB93_9BACI|nr:iron ABC transporter permease [Metabacillus idriensis]MCM3597640.1 iron ABC transporter permease [Metabacillus idriensis]MRX54552.1 iron chelate uptake ABC transporter family permease subunit [Metabacillus idriensis]OHR65716.1 iron ABC transporter [Bacillus sp. HMSC76G11]